MNPALEEAFSSLAGNALNAAAKVKCSFDDYVEGLRIMRGEVAERLNGAISELEEMRAKDKGE